MGKPNSKDPLETINKKLDMVINLVAFQIAQHESSRPGAMVILNRLGLSQSTIATICDSTPKAVSVRLAEAKRKSRKNKK